MITLSQKKKKANKQEKRFLDGANGKVRWARGINISGAPTKRPAQGLAYLILTSKRAISISQINKPKMKKPSTGRAAMRTPKPSPNLWLTVGSHATNKIELENIF